MLYKVLAMISLSTFLLTGCQVDFRKSVDDYTGSDAAKIRVLDKGIIGLEVYKKSVSCYEEVDSRKLTSAFQLSLISQADQSISSTKSVGMKMPSKFQDQVVKEYSIKAGEYIAIVNTTRQETYSGTTNSYDNKTYFIPEAGHEYEIHAEPSQHLNIPSPVIIEDLTGKNKLKEWKGDICKKKGFL